MDKNNTNELSAVLSGVAGEYFVAGELSRRGFLASITLRNTKGVDIQCSNGDASKSVSIQVKTNKGSSRKWVMNRKAEDYYADNLFYIFVNLNDNKKSPDYFVVPSKVAAEYTKKNHIEWLGRPRRDGNPHKDNDMRKFVDLEERYLNRWELLGLDIQII
ncbi:MAG: aspartate ammonia-lyase [bacterium]|nr:aspartate ammonia-lyase [bacterium]